MKEKDFISVIKDILNSKYIGDDCAYLKDLEIVVTQDSLVEDIHFKLDYITPRQLGYKSVMVNLSDIASSGAEAKYLTISLSLPNNIEKTFIEEFYLGAREACGNNVEIVGGDITGAEKIFVSICAIGSSKGRTVSSRKNAHIGDKIVICGNHGSSAAGLKLLFDGKTSPEKFIKAHLKPKAQTDFGREIGEKINRDYAMMDTSDGLMETLSTIANESDVLLEVNFEKIPTDNDLKQFDNWQELVLFGGEDYGIVAVVPEDFKCLGIEIGKVKTGHGVNLICNGQTIHYSKKEVDEKIFNHFN